MKRLAFAFLLLIAPTLVQADPKKDMIAEIVDVHILPSFQTLAERGQNLADVAIADCDPNSAKLRQAYADAFDAWVLASHLRFGPTEVDDRAFALAFWPDSRGVTPRTLSSLLTDQDPIALSADEYAEVSIAARGFYALEFLLYDEALSATGEGAYHCQLVQTVSADIAMTSQDIIDGWQVGYAATMLHPTSGGIYRNDDEALQQLFKSLSTGLQFTAETRLGRPLGTFDQPRPTRAEVWRSGRSSRHVWLSLTALNRLALHLSGDNAALAAKFDNNFEQALAHLAALDDPIFASVSAPQTRLKVEVVQQSIETIRSIVRDELGPTLGVAAGFNALDGD